MEDERTKAIGQRAFEIWEAEGRKHGLDEVYLIRARNEIDQQRIADTKPNAAPCAGTASMSRKTHELKERESAAGEAGVPTYLEAVRTPR